ncbi:hypothetical protein AXG93_1217s1490 [Marchantia polymorpha subsp. ruderalis]|uniref:Uncharacterized protein n=1 Tax=Marchantia polymorpha subsp. ruderalis TaxID=1480154 RepID=A0A176VT66_MARPO|nr:hypothetical protein AXG93_1217s1490 [Marchantia polymorpha subsp. ruderalis]
MLSSSTQLDHPLAVVVGADLSLVRDANARRTPAQSLLASSSRVTGHQTRLSGGFDTENTGEFKAYVGERPIEQRHASA